MYGSWFMLREGELSTLRARFVTLAREGVPTVSLLLPASKNDSSAQGARRTQACVCPRGRVLYNCPVHAAWDQILVLRRRFPERFTVDGPDLGLPLFPRPDGRPATKAAITETILTAARLLGTPLRSEDGTARISGHSLRPTGAQGLTRLGVDCWAVQLLGRWGSAAVLRYIREASASPEAAIARSQMLSRTLSHVTADAGERASITDLRDFTAAEVRGAVAAAVPNIVKEIKASLAPHLTEHLNRRRGPPGSCPSSSSSSSGSSSSGPASPGNSDSGEGEGDPESFQIDISSAISAAPDGGLDIISSSTSGRQHKVLVGPSACDTPLAWICLCGWRFGRTSTARKPLPSDARCQRCWPP